MSFKPNEPILINKSFGFSSSKAVTPDNGLPYVIVEGYASKMVDSSGEFVIDSDNENINTGTYKKSSSL